MHEVIVKDNFLSDEDLKNIQKYLLFENSFPWYYEDLKVFESNDHRNIVDPIYNYQFVHTFYDFNRPLSNFFNLIDPLIKLIDPISIVKIKTNLTLATKEVIPYGFHIDFPNVKTNTELKTALFYVNTNDGLTVFEDGGKIQSIENRFAFFNASLKHSGTTTTNKKRVVINFNFY